MAEDDDKSLILSTLKNMQADLKTCIKEGRETKECVTKVQSDLALHRQKTELCLEKHNEILSEHSARSEALQEQNEMYRREYKSEVFSEGVSDPDKRRKTIVGRIESLEISKNRWKWLATIIVSAAALLTALQTIFEIL